MASQWPRVGVVVLLTAVLVMVVSSSQCPSVCICRWKYGKQTVECRNQQLASLPSGVDVDTQVLDLNGNNLQTLPRHAFKRAGLINLQKIYLSNCNIGAIDDAAFAQLTNLVELDLSDNLLTEIPAQAFSHVPALRYLQLRGNKLHKIGSNSFDHTPSLVRLDLSNADIRSVSARAFNHLSLLENLELQSNYLTEIPAAAVQSLKKIHGLEVHDNNWICDCRALPLWQLLEDKENGVPHPVSPSCASPERVRGKTFRELTERDFACPPHIRHNGRFVKGVAGENATIACPVDGQPPPEVLWYKGEAPVVNGSVIGLGPQRFYVITEGNRNLVSRLVITGAQETDSGPLRCVAINSAGSATANFTLAVTMRAATKAKLGSGHIAGISVGLVMLAVIALVVGFLILARSRPHPSPTPAKDSPSTPSSVEASPNEPNPVQKPPRLTDVNGSPATYRSSALGNPDVINEAERVVRVNGHLPNGTVQEVNEGGDYTRVEGDSLYPSGLWPDEGGSSDATDNPEPPRVIHEHFNPGYMPNDPVYDSYGPLHSTPYRSGYGSQDDVDPQIYGYPADYGLPIPEAGNDPRGTKWNMSTLRGPQEDDDPQPGTYDSRQHLYESQQELYSSGQNLKDSSQDLYGVRAGRPPVYGYRQEVFGSRENVPEGAESPQSPTQPLGERPWVPGSQAPPHARGGVQVLPPLPNGLANRIKARDSPDEGYQEGTEV